jgi:hypothetical protein
LTSTSSFFFFFFQGVLDGYSDNGWGVGPKHSSMVSLMKYTMNGRIFGSFSDALKSSNDGQTICFSPGEHEVSNNVGLHLPVRLIAGNGLGDVTPLPSTSKKVARGAFNAGLNNGGGTSSSSSSSSSSDFSSSSRTVTKKRNDLVTLKLSNTLELKCNGTVHMYGLNIVLEDNNHINNNSNNCMAITGGSLHMERITVSNVFGKNGMTIKGKKSKVTAHQCEFIDSGNATCNTSSSSSGSCSSNNNNSGAGIVVERGEIFAQSTLISNNNGNGVTIIGSNSNVRLTNCEICYNHLNGIHLLKGGKEPSNMEGNWVHNNNKVDLQEK